MRIFLVFLFVACSFLSIAFFRGAALGQEIEPHWPIITVLASIVLGAWLLLTAKKQKK